MPLSPPMKTSPDGLQKIAGFEGEIDHVYRDIAGIATIGVGHALRPGENYPNGISHTDALALLAKDVAVAEAAVNKLTNVPLSQNQFDALVSWTFNVGAGAFAHSTLLLLLNRLAYSQAADELLKWCKVVSGGSGGVLTVSPGLLQRRKAELELFLTPVPAPASVAPAAAPSGYSSAPPSPCH